MNDSQLLSNAFIKNFTNTNLDDMKIKMQAHLDAVLYVNSLLNDDIISDFRCSSVFYDDMHTMDFYEFLDHWFMSDLDVEQNNRDVMIYLQYIYNS